VIPRDLNYAIQVVLAERGLSFEMLPEVPRLIKHYVSGGASRQFTNKGLERTLLGHVTNIPRKGARGGYENIGTPADRLHYLIEDIMAALDSAKFVQEKKS
jgi:hypothetical protein